MPKERILVLPIHVIILSLFISYTFVLSVSLTEGIVALPKIYFHRPHPFRKKVNMGPIDVIVSIKFNIIRF